MPQHLDDSHRNVVPRWRPLRVTMALGELEPIADVRVPRGTVVPAPGELEELTTNWQRDRNPIHAANLVDAGHIIGPFQDALEAARWLVDNGGVSEISIELAKRLLSEEERTLEPLDVSHTTRYSRIATYRHQLKQRPRNALLWVDLAREYAVLGQSGPARKAISVALSLSPDNRFVLRSASRFYLHDRDPERAHDVLARKRATALDPWLLAAEIVAARLRGRTSRLVKTSIQLLESAKFSPRHVSELASAIGTLEHWTGTKKRMKRFVSQALVEPTENSVAQAAWLARKTLAFEVPETVLEVPLAFEAGAWQALQSGDYQRALTLAESWHQDEPFSSRPVLFGSWVAAMALEDFDAALGLLTQASYASPNNPHIVAQTVYCEAARGNTVAAAEQLVKLEALLHHDQGNYTLAEWKVMVNADRGLIAFREGRVEEGRAYYQRAIAIASKHKMDELRISALFHLTKEEVNAGVTFSVDRRLLERELNRLPRVIQDVMKAALDRGTNNSEATGVLRRADSGLSQNRK